MRLFPRIKRIAITNTIDKEGDVQTALQVVLEVKFSEEIGRGLADIARSDDLACDIYEIQRKLALEGATTTDQV